MYRESGSQVEPDFFLLDSLAFHPLKTNKAACAPGWDFADSLANIMRDWITTVRGFSITV